MWFPVCRLRGLVWRLRRRLWWPSLAGWRRLAVRCRSVAPSVRTPLFCLCGLRRVRRLGCVCSVRSVRVGLVRGRGRLCGRFRLRFGPARRSCSGRVAVPVCRWSLVWLPVLVRASLRPLPWWSGVPCRRPGRLAPWVPLVLLCRLVGVWCSSVRAGRPGGRCSASVVAVGPGA